MDRKFSWYCEPPEWSDTLERLSGVTGFEKDFWQSTFYGFQRDNGHFYHTEVRKDFSAEVVIDGYYEELYDQAGLMLGVDALNWIKTEIEFTDEIPHFSTVLGLPYTHGTLCQPIREKPSPQLRQQLHQFRWRPLFEFLD